MNKVGPHNYFQVSGWMLQNLKLSGNDLMVFAIIYGFSQDENSTFNGSLKYLEEFTGASRTTVITSLKFLVQKEFIIKLTKDVNGVTFNSYKIAQGVQKLYGGVVQNSDGGGIKSVRGGGTEIVPNNISLYNKEDNKNNTEALPVVDPDQPFQLKAPSPKAPKVKSSAKKEKVVEWPWTNPEIEEAWQRWKDYKRDEHKFSYKSPATETATLKQLYEDTGGSLSQAIKWIDYSISRNWKGIFQPKENQQNGSTTKAPQQNLSRSERQSENLQYLADEAKAGFERLYGRAPND